MGENRTQVSQSIALFASLTNESAAEIKLKFEIEIAIETEIDIEIEIEIETETETESAFKLRALCNASHRTSQLVVRQRQRRLYLWPKHKPAPTSCL